MLWRWIAERYRKRPIKSEKKFNKLVDKDQRRLFRAQARKRR